MRVASGAQGPASAPLLQSRTGFFAFGPSPIISVQPRKPAGPKIVGRARIDRCRIGCTCYGTRSAGHGSALPGESSLWGQFSCGASVEVDATVVDQVNEM